MFIETNILGGCGSHTPICGEKGDEVHHVRRVYARVPAAAAGGAEGLRAQVDPDGVQARGEGGFLGDAHGGEGGRGLCVRDEGGERALLQVSEGVAGPGDPGGRAVHRGHQDHHRRLGSRVRSPVG